MGRNKEAFDLKCNYFKVEVFIPESALDRLQHELNAVGALTLNGNYDYCMSVTEVTGFWRPLEGAKPFIGSENHISRETELKIEFNCKDEVLKKAIDTIRAYHPYEEPVINVISLWSLD